MISTVANDQSRMMGLADKYWEHIRDEYPAAAGYTSVDTLHDIRGGTSAISRFENIEMGRSGIVLLLIEMYEQLQDVKYLQLADELVQGLLVHCKGTANNNFGLYTGRAGVIYALIRYYSITSKENMLKEAEQIADTISEDYIYSEHVPDTLYDGRAGTLLVFVQLYQLTGQQALLDLVNLLVKRIISKAKVSRDGFFYNKESELNSRPVCSFADGTAGIRYVLAWVNDFARNSTLDLVIREIDRYTASCWIAANNNWADHKIELVNKDQLNRYVSSYEAGNHSFLEPANNFGWANGCVGILGAFPDSIDKASIDWKAMQATGLYEGIAGLGLFFLSIKEQYNNPVFDGWLDEIARQLLTGAEQVSVKGGMMHGNLGVFYFLLKHGCSNNQTSNFLYPAKEVKWDHPSRPIPIAITDADVRKGLLISYYPRTCLLLEQIAFAGAGRYFEQLKERQLQGELDRFGEYIKNIVLPALPPGSSMYVRDIFNLEKEKTRFFLMEDRPNLSGYLAHLTHRNAIIQLLNQPNEWLLNQKLCVSADVKILDVQWDWTFSNDNTLLKERLADNLKMPPQKLGCVLKSSNSFETSEFIMRGQAMLLLQSFKVPKMVKDVLAQVRYFVQSLRKEELNHIVLQLTGASDPGEFLEELENITLYEIRIWLYEKILVIQH